MTSRRPPRDAISSARCDLNRRQTPPRTCTMHARPTPHTCACPCKQLATRPRSTAAPQHRSTHAPRQCDFGREGPVYADCFGWDCVRRAGSPGKGGRRRHAPPLPEPHRPPRYPCTFLDLTVSFRMPRFDSTSIDSIVLFVCLLLCIFFGVVVFTSLLVRGCAELLAYSPRCAP